MRKPSSGVTLVETLIVIAVTAVLLAIVVPSFTGLLQRQRVQGVAEQALYDLHEASSLALARQESVFVGAQAGRSGSCYIVHVGNKGGCTCSPGGSPVCDAVSTALKHVAFASDAPVQLVAITSRLVTFDALRARTVSSGSYDFGTDATPILRVAASARRLKLCELGKPGCP